MRPADRVQLAIIKRHGMNKNNSFGPEEEEVEKRKRVKLASLDALRVIALVWIISGHCLLCLGFAVANINNFFRHSRDLVLMYVSIHNGALLQN